MMKINGFIKKHTVFYMEVTKLLQNKKQLLVTMTVPVFMVFSMLMLISLLNKKVETSHIEIYCDVELETSIREAFGDSDLLFYDDQLLDKEEKNTDSSGNILIFVIANNVSVVYDSSKVTNSGLIGTAKQIAEYITAYKINKETIGDFLLKTNNVQTINICDSKGYLENVVMPFSDLIFMIVLLVVSSCISSIVVETVTGEKERGSFEQLLLTGTPLRKILFGKYMFCTLYMWIMLCLSEAFFWVGLSVCNKDIYSVVKMFEKPGFTGMFAVAICLLLMSMTVTTGYLFIANLFDRTKYASRYCSFAQLGFSGLSYLPNIVGKNKTEYFPIVNRGEILFNVITGESVIVDLLICFIITICIVTILMQAANRRQSI